MSQQDKDRFSSFAHAQVAVANEIYDYLDKPNILLFCPTRTYYTIIKIFISSFFACRVL
jgi:hypothetical protein